MTSPQPPLEHPEIDYCTLSFSILGIIGTILAILHLTFASIKNVCVPDNTLYLHFLLLTGILTLFVSTCTFMFTENYTALCLTQLSLTVCVCCILMLAINLFFYIHKQYFSRIFVLFMPILFVFPILIMFITCSRTDDYDKYECMKYAITNTYLYLGYFLTITTILSLCLYRTLYGKLLLTTLTSWISWNIYWSLFHPYSISNISYMYLTLGYILVSVLHVPDFASKVFTYITSNVRPNYNLETRFLLLSSPPPDIIKYLNKHEYLSHAYWLYNALY
nr:G protein-coupled receptor 9 [Elephant endotheliotropic herpesvirus 1A]